MHGRIVVIRSSWRTRLAARLGATALALLGLATLAAGAAGAATAASAPLTPAAASLGDALASTAARPAVHPLRIITLAPSTTELVFAAGAGAQIVGTVLASDYPPAASTIPRVGDGIQLNTETILTLKPDVVLGWQPSGAVRALGAILAPLNIPLIYVNPQSLADIPREIRELGAQLGTKEHADQNAAELEHRIDALTPGDKLLTVFLEVSAEPLYTLGKDPLINDLLARCGGINLYADSPIIAPQVSIESVLHRHPDALIISPNGRETLAARREFWRTLRLPAAQAGRIYAIDPDWLHRPGPRMVDAAEKLCSNLAQARATLP